MITYDSFTTTPAGSLVILEEQEREPHILTLSKLPGSVRDLAVSPKTGAFVRGLVKQFQLRQDLATTVAFAIWRVLAGNTALAQLPALLSTELKIANDKAQKIAQEIERDLLAPVALELNQYLAQQKKKTGSIADKLAEQPRPAAIRPQTTTPRFPRKPATPPNILNLKDNKKPPTPPPIPR